MKIFYKKHFKTNLLMSVLVNLGIQVAYVFRTQPSLPQVVYSKIIYLSQRRMELPELEREVLCVEELPTLDSETLLIFDADHLSFKAIIDRMKSLSDKSRVYYRIQPKKLNFILGSDSNSVQGVVLDLKS
jgi:hypothetical protein